MAWYDTGTVSVTNGSTAVTGSGTNFVAGAQVGEGFYGPDGRLYEIQAIVSATSLTLADAYLGTTQTGQEYKIVPTQSLVADLASQVSTLISDYQSVADNAGEGKFQDGSATSPGITFTLDQDTGFFRDTANEIGVAVAGVKKAEFNSSGMQFEDNSKAIFGAGSDLQIYHDGTDSIIADVGAGDLNISGGNDVRIRTPDGENGLILNQDGAIKLYYDGVQKLATTSTGVDVTGTVTADGLTVSNAVGSVLKLESTGTGLGAGSVIGDIQFYGNDASVPGAGVKASITVDTVAALGDDAQMKFTTSDGTTNNLDRMLIANNGDISFYEDTGTTPKFFWDASAESLTIGTVVNSQVPLNVSAATVGSSNAIAFLRNSSADGNGLVVDVTNTPTDYVADFRIGNSSKVRIDSSGNVGIGTSSPAFNAGSGIEIERSGEATLRLQDTTNTANGEVRSGNAGLTFYAGAYGTSGAPFIWNAGGTERMRITSTGNVGIGTSSPQASQKLHIYNSAGNAEMTLQSADGSDAALVFGDTTDFSRGKIKYTSTDAMAFEVNNLSEAMRIDASGNLLVGTTTALARLVLDNASSTTQTLIVTKDSGGTGAHTHIEFQNTNGAVGSITTNGSATAYNTSSDYRLKEDVQPMVGASDRVLSLNPVNFAWKSDGTRTDGFLAHEAQAVAPYAVTGEKDGEEMQAIDHSKLVPLLTAALQEALTEIAALKDRVAALEA